MLNRAGPYVVACGLAGIGLAARIAAGLFLPHHAWVSDELEYLGAAKMAAAGFGMGFYDTAPWLRPPGYILFLTLILRLAGTTWAIYLLQALLLSAAAVAITLLAWEVWGRAGGIAAAILTNAYYPWVVYPNLLLSESLCIFLISYATWMALREHWTGSAGAGIALGLASLTRGLAGALVLPLVLHQVLVKKWRHAVLLLLFWSAVQVPWVARNYMLYGGLAQPDLTAGYNLWFSAEGLRNESRLVKELMGIGNPVERDHVAQARALKAIWSDPGRYLKRGIKEAADLWLPNFAAEERLVSGFTLGDVPPWHLAFNFVFGDFLFALMLGLGLIGFTMRFSHPLAKLCLLWTVFLTSISFLLFATDRFRMLAVIPVVLMASGAGEILSTMKTMSRKKAGILAVLFLLPLTVTVSVYPFDLLFLGMLRWWEVTKLAEVRNWLREGYVERANLELRSMADTLVETRVLKVQAQALLGQEGVVPQSAAGLTDLEAMGLGDLWRFLGRTGKAEQFFSSSQVASSERIDWMWRRNLTSPPSGLELGKGLEVGFIRGFSRPEWDGTRWFRWTTGAAEILLSGNKGRSRIIVEMASYRPAGWPPVRVTLMGNGKLLWEGTLAGPWRQVTADSEDPSASLHMAILSDTFVPGFHDKRELGVMVSRIRLEGQ
jgi:4-amino-4-deoxy-L-arabinose transferase-like glycosyltransferase